MKEIKACLLKLQAKHLAPELKQAASFMLLRRQIERDWPKIMGKLAKVLFFRYVRYKTLYISTLNPSWKTEIAYMEKKILANLHKFVPKTAYIKKIKVVVSYDVKDPGMVMRKKMVTVQEKAKGLKESLLRIKQAIEFKDKQMADAGYQLCSSCHLYWVSNLDDCVLCRNK
eukprot:COSAG01_NODE_9_length_43729_cov_66.133463_36_plen_171_part_00